LRKVPRRGSAANSAGSAAFVFVRRSANKRSALEFQRPTSLVGFLLKLVSDEAKIRVLSIVLHASLPAVSGRDPRPRESSTLISHKHGGAAGSVGSFLDPGVSVVCVRELFRRGMAALRWTSSPCHRFARRIIRAMRSRCLSKRKPVACKPRAPCRPHVDCRFGRITLRGRLTRVDSAVSLMSSRIVCFGRFSASPGVDVSK